MEIARGVFGSQRGIFPPQDSEEDGLQDVFGVCGASGDAARDAIDPFVMVFEEGRGSVAGAVMRLGPGLWQGVHGLLLRRVVTLHNVPPCVSLTGFETGLS
jgi:hypothetical protein